MTVHYERTEELLIEASIQYALRTEPGRRQTEPSRRLVAALRGLVLALGVLALAVLLVFPPLPTAFIVGALGAAGFYVAHPWIYASDYRRILRRMVRRQWADTLGPAEVTLLPDALYSRSVTGENKRLWSSIRSIEETADYVLFAVAEGSVAVPKAAFAAPEQCAAFLETARAFRDGRHPLAPTRAAETVTQSQRRG